MPIDYSRYPPNWKSEIVPAILARADGRCEWCDLINGQIIFSVQMCLKTEGGRYTDRAVWFRSKADAVRESKEFPNRMKNVRVVLTIAHLDHDEENHAVGLDRLAALCQQCHLRYDAKEKYRRMLAKSIPNA